MHESMLWTHFSGFLVACGLAVATGQATEGVAFCMRNPEVIKAIMIYSLASAVGQNFIYYTITQFNPLILTTVTTTRKIFSVLLDIVSRGYVLNGTQLSGVAAASLGVLGELQEKFGKKQHAHSK